MKKLVLSIIVLAIIGIGIAIYEINSSDEKTSQDIVSSDNSLGQSKSEVPEEKVIEITFDGFSPNVLEINKGDKVTWINNADAESWPASAIHPTHTAYPGADYDIEGSFSGSKGCVSEGVSKRGAFDSCKGLKKGESWTFTFEQKGTWSYHDHLQTEKYGKIIVN